MSKLHVVEGSTEHIPVDWFNEVLVDRAEGKVLESQTEIIQIDDLATEW